MNTTKGKPPAPHRGRTTLRTENARMREALAFYADQGNYVPGGIAPTIWTDNGDRARAALNAQ